MNKYENALETVNKWWNHEFKDETTETIREVLGEKIAEQKKDWHREPEFDEQYYCVGEDGGIEAHWYNSDYDKRLYNTFNCFPCSEYTEEKLIADGVPDMGLLGRIHYQWGHAHGDWLTEAERLDTDCFGYYVCFCGESKKWVNLDAFTFYSDKRFKHKATAEGLCDWLNENCDHRGHVKGE